VVLLFLLHALQKFSHLAIFFGHLLECLAGLLIARNEGLSFAYQLQVPVIWDCAIVRSHSAQARPDRIVPNVPTKLPRAALTAVLSAKARGPGV
jgi:hypothetical protein